MIFTGAKGVLAPGLYVGAAVLFWLKDEVSPRIGLIQHIRPLDEDTASLGMGDPQPWTGTWPRIDVLAISPQDQMVGEPVFVNALPHAEDVEFQLALQGVPFMVAASCPRYVLVTNLEGKS